MPRIIINLELEKIGPVEADKLLPILYHIEDVLQYNCKSVSHSIDTIQKYLKGTLWKPRSEEEIIEYLGLDKSNNTKEWWKSTLKIAKEVEKTWIGEIRKDKVGYCLACDFYNGRKEMIENLDCYELIEISNIKNYIVLYEKVIRGEKDYAKK